MTDPITAAERAIQKILIDMEEEFGVIIKDVRIDTHRFSTLQTEIFLEEGQDPR